MSTQPTVADLAHRAMQLNDLLNSDFARQFIRNNNIRSNTKLETLVSEQLAGKSAEEIAEICKPAEGASTKTAPKKAETKPKVDKKEADGKKFERKGRESREVKVVMEGARGFRFGPVWNESVIKGEGVALLPGNKNKLLKHAQSLGVNRFTEEDDSAKIAKAIASKVEASMQTAE